MSSPTENKTGGAKSFRSDSNRGGGERKPYAQTGSQGRSNRNKPQENRQGAPQKSSGCFLCDGPHRYRECPKKQLLNAWRPLLTRRRPRSRWSHKHLRVAGMMRRRMRTTWVLSLNGATHCLIKWRLMVGRVKAINSAAKPIAGVAKSVLIKVGPFEGKTNLSVVVMDDFKLILRLEILQNTRTPVLPHVDSLMMMGAKPCVIPTLVGRTGEKNLSAMQFEKGCKRSEPSYLCTLRFDEIEEASGPIPGVVKRLLKEFEDMMLDELPRKLPPKRAVDHEIELVSGTKPPPGHRIGCRNLSLWSLGSS
ncbi:UNVERIFIED_CONTAM: hypothetical protein Slati_3417700 [Sesamum latifolium]|uniref:Gag-asp_proteas domain-containing protein n=1 Tax=Sesamum latifolium TaxID=2727402 RepID=A0AAW2UFC0_9LAMI